MKDFRDKKGDCTAVGAQQGDCEYFVFQNIGWCCAKCKHDIKERCKRPEKEKK